MYMYISAAFIPTISLRILYIYRYCNVYVYNNVHTGKKCPAKGSDGGRAVLRHRCAAGGDVKVGCKTGARGPLQRRR